jgi:hypothetical protein
LERSAATSTNQIAALPDPQPQPIFSCLFFHTAKILHDHVWLTSGIDRDGAKGVQLKKGDVYNLELI